MFGLPAGVDELEPHARWMLLRHAAMYEDMEWCQGRHSDDLHVPVTEDDVKRDAFASAMIAAVAAAADGLCHAFYVLDETRRAGSTGHDQVRWMHRGEAHGQNYLAYQVIKGAYYALARHGMLVRHSKLWDVIDKDPDLKRRNDHLDQAIAVGGIAR